MKPGSVISDRYRVVRLIGKGGMGAVYQVVNTRISRSFALKRLDPVVAEDAAALARFKREAMVVASLRHPNIVDVVDWEKLEDGSPCIILEYLRGHDLAERIAGTGPLPWPMLARISRQILAALEVAHAAGIVHRDLKPQNVFLAQDDARREHVKLLDFGLSKVRHSRSVLSDEDRLLGTPAYMSPEQANGHSDVGHEADVWAMGAILYEMATGQKAFAGSSVPAILYQIIHGEPARLDTIRADAPPEFVDLVARVLCHDPARRLTQVSVLRTELNVALARVAPAHPDEDAIAPSPVERSISESIVATEPSTLSRAASQASGRTVPGRAGSVVLGVLLVAFALAIAVWVRGANENAEPAPATGKDRGPPRAVSRSNVVAPDAAPAVAAVSDAGVASPARPARRTKRARNRPRPTSPTKPTPFGADQIFGR